MITVISGYKPRIRKKTKEVVFSYPELNDDGVPLVEEEIVAQVDSIFTNHKNNVRITTQSTTVLNQILINAKRKVIDRSDVVFEHYLKDGTLIKAIVDESIRPTAINCDDSNAYIEVFSTNRNQLKELLGFLT